MAQTEPVRETRGGGGAQRGGGRVAGTGPLQQPGAAQHQLLGPHRDRQRFDDHRSEASAERHQGDDRHQHEPQQQRAGPVRQVAERGLRGARHRIARGGDVPAERVLGAEQVEGQRGVVRAAHLVVRQQVRAAQHEHAVVRGHEGSAVVAAEAALGLTRGPVQGRRAAEARLLAGDGERLRAVGEVPALGVRLQHGVLAQRAGGGDRRSERGEGDEVGLDQHQTPLAVVPRLGEGGELGEAELAGRGDQHGAPAAQRLGGIGGVAVHVDLDPEVLEHLHHGFRALPGGGIRFERAVAVDAARHRDQDRGEHREHDERDQPRMPPLLLGGGGRDARVGPAARGRRSRRGGEAHPSPPGRSERTPAATGAAPAPAGTDGAGASAAARSGEDSAMYSARRNRSSACLAVARRWE